MPGDLANVIIFAQIEDKTSIKFVHLTDEIYANHQQQISDYFAGIAEDLKKVYFMHCDLTGLNYLRILSHFPGLEVLDFHLCVIVVEPVDDIPPPPVTLKNLKKFQVLYFFFSEEIDQQRLIELAPRFLGQTESLEDLRFYIGVPEGDVDHYADIRAIAKVQMNLKMLYVGDNRFFDGPLSDPQFQLETYFMPVTKSNFTDVQLRNFHEFFATQTEISHLVCNVPVDFRSPTLEKIVKSFDTEHMDSFREEYAHMEPNPYVKSLYAEFQLNDDEQGRAEIIAKIVEKYPNVEDLEFNYNILGDHTDWSMLEPVNQLKHLRKLSCLSLGNRQISRLKVPTLRSIEISQNIDDLESLNRFVIRHPDLEKMNLIFEMPSYDSLLPALNMFIEFTLKIMSKLETISVSFYEFEDEQLDAEEIQKIVNENSVQDDFVLIFSFDDSDRPEEVFTKM